MTSWVSFGPTSESRRRASTCSRRFVSIRAGAWTRSLSLSITPSLVRLKPRRSLPSVPPEAFDGASEERSSEELMGALLSFHGPSGLSQGLLGLSGFRAGGIQRDDFLEILQGLVATPGLQQHLTEAVVTLRVARIDLDSPAEGGLGFGDVLFLQLKRAQVVKDLLRVAVSRILETLQELLLRILFATGLHVHRPESVARIGEVRIQAHRLLE